MKSTLAIGRRNRFGVLFALFIPIVLGACARTIAFETSVVVPAAVGKVKITIGTGFLSKTLTGSLKTSTSFKPVKVFITGESAGEILHPGVPVVLTTKPF